jgi:hypothetical protein
MCRNAPRSSGERAHERCQFAFSATARRRFAVSVLRPLAGWAAGLPVRAGVRRVRCYAALGMIHPAIATKWLAAARITSE